MTELFVGVTVVLGGLAWTASLSGHPAEGFIPVLLILAARSCTRSQPLRTGAAIGVAAATKLWGALGLAIVPLERNFNRRVVAAVTAIGILFLCYAPFFLFGDVETFSFEWTVHPQSPIGFFLPWGAPVSWIGRVIQSLVPLAGGALIALKVRGDAGAVWKVPLAIVALRLLSDPLEYHYYWLEVGVIALIGLATLLPSRPTLLMVPLAAGFYATLWPFYYLTGYTLAAWITAISILMLVLIWLSVRASEVPAIEPS
jgi:hypothetical protein